MFTFFLLLALPLCAFRLEIRPETFSYLFLGIYFYILYFVSERKLNPNFLWIIPFLQVFWVNIHIFFIFGPILIGFIIFHVFLKKDKPLLKKCLLILICSLFISVLNPQGINGFLLPLTIFKQYGYMLAENQSIFFMQQRFFNPVYYQFELFVLVISLGFIIDFIIHKKKDNVAFLFIYLFFSIIVFKTSRAIPLFGFFFIPIGAKLFYDIAEKFPVETKKGVNEIMLFIVVGIILIGYIFHNHYYSPFKQTFGLGLLPNTEKSAEFYKNNGIKGPIFNNYDIGGYLIFYLFPQEKIFVDNRPEVYSVDFFRNKYIPMQEDTEVWNKTDSKYSFNVIYFYRHDLTSWGQNFLIQRVKDPNWTPVYVDDFTIIFVKRNKENKTVIKKYELPPSMFQVTSS